MPCRPVNLRTRTHVDTEGHWDVKPLACAFSGLVYRQPEPRLRLL